VVLALALGIGAVDVSAQVTSLRGLTFGTITSGTTTSVLKTSVGAAQWRITGTFLLEGTFQLTLPTTLTGPGTPIPLSFSTSNGQRSTSNNAGTGSAFNPHTSQTIPVALSGTTVYVWLGGSASVPLNQTPGNYSATVVMTVSGML
jgi:hypothetical protein